MAKSISNKHQIAKLVELMECNPDIAKAMCTKPLAKHRWESFAGKLNSLGPPYKSAEKWAKVWSDLKSKTKKKLTIKRAQLSAANESVQNYLSPLDAAMDQILELNSMDPLSDDRSQTEENEEVSLTHYDIKTEVDILNEVSDPSCENPSRPLSPPVENGRSLHAEVAMPSTHSIKRLKHTTRNPNANAERMALLETYTKEEREFHKEMCKRLEAVESAVSLMRYQQREHYELMRDMKKEELKLLKECNEKNDKYRAEKLKLLRNMQ